MAAMQTPEAVDLCLMNYPSRRGIRLNPKQSRWTRRDGSGKLIQTTRCPRSFPVSPPHTAFLTLLLPDHLRLTVIGERWRCCKLFHRRISPIKMLRGAGINLESTSIPSNVTRPADTSLISVRLANWNWRSAGMPELSLSLPRETG